MKLYKEERHIFPPANQVFDDGILAFSDELSVDMLFEAYSFGIFPWPHEDMPLLWFSPEERGVLDFSELHISKSLTKFMKKTEFKVTFNKCFSEVIQQCSISKRKGQSGTWITPQMLRVYKDFHKKGYAHSVECWDGDDLVGGIYGVYVAGVFSGESMFFKKANASKFCLLKLIEALQGNNIQWMDIQMVTPLLESIGGRYISRSDFLDRLNESKKIAKRLNLQKY